MNRERQRDATEQIWRELSDRLRRFVRSRIASAADADDVLQTVFLRIHSHFDDLRHADRLESWVFQIVRNAVTDHFRKKRDASIPDDSLVEDADDTAAADVNAELAGCLHALIERLPDDQRRAVSMYEFEGLSQQAIADRELISLSGAKSRVQRGRKSLEAMLKACCEFQLDGRGNVVEYEANQAGFCDGTCGE